MIDIAILRALAAAGASVEAIIAAVEASQKSEIELAEQRRLRDAERKRRSRNVTRTSADIRNVTRTECDKRKGFILPKENNFPSSNDEGHFDPEKELFKRGKQILGNTAGGLIAKLLTAKSRNVALARAALETASTKQNPAEYVAAIVRGAKPDPDDWKQAIQ